MEFYELNIWKKGFDLLAVKLHYLSEKDFSYLDEEYSGLSIGINSYIKSLSRYKKFK